MAVGTYALTSLAKAKAYLRLYGNQPLESAMSVIHTGDGTAATVEVTSTSVVLVQTGGTGAGTDTILFSADATLTEMVDAINALTRSYRAVLYGNSAAATTDMEITAATSCLSAEVTLKYTNNYLIEQIIDAATAEIENICGRQFKSRDYTEEYDGQGGQYHYPDNWPVSKVSRLSVGRLNTLGVWCNSGTATYADVRSDGTNLTLTYDDSSGTTTANIAYSTYTTITALAAQINATAGGWAALGLGYGDYLTADILDLPASYSLNEYAYLQQPYQSVSGWRWDADKGRLWIPSGFSAGTQNIWIEYTGGYSTIPADVEAACLDLVRWMYNATSRDPALQSEKLGDYAWAAKSGSSGGSSGFMTELEARLAQYKRITV
ncbi:hypothetical protein CMI37_35780 [Candidatus Pacearchaeota archaeon]|nr:hypothetical protein [Candidatus Pacearchaeota archaeon]|tara:strand:+ start:1551 stop:2684 length:1134 start_codon:yes stop_codon:yes gene_type:complete